MSFADLMSKLVNGESLSEQEKQELVFEAKRIQEVVSTLGTVIIPGSGTLKIDHLISNDVKINTASITDAEIHSAKAGDGDVSLDGEGIWIKNQQAAFGFEDTGNHRFKLYLASGPTDELVLVNKLADAAITMRAQLDTNAFDTNFLQDYNLTERGLVELYPASNGARLDVGHKIEVVSEGSSGGETYIGLGQATNTPTTPSYGNVVNIYMKGSKLVFCYLDGVPRYKYLDLAGTGVTWVYSATAP